MDSITNRMRWKSGAIPAFVLAILFCCCGPAEGNKKELAQENTPSAAKDTTEPCGKVKDSLACSSHSGQIFAIYLPKGYQPSGKYPLALFLDAHGRGALPLGKYQELADTYGWVLAGSDAARNGVPFPVIHDGVQELLGELSTRFSIDSQQIYLVGFSGGARNAATVALADGGINGVIGCGAGFPNQDIAPRQKFDYFCMAGCDDFNLVELQQLDHALGQSGLAHQLLSFTGKHEWPPASEMGTAFLWMQVMAMKEHRRVLDRAMVTALHDDYQRRIAGVQDDLVYKYQLLRGMAAALNGIGATEEAEKELAAIESAPGTRAQFEARQQAEEEEMKRQQELAGQFTSQSPAWWVQKIGELNRHAGNAPTLPERQSYRRLVNYIGLIGFMATSHALGTDDLVHAADYLTIFRTADPRNADCYYLQALFFAKKGDGGAAIGALQSAADLGYSELNQVVSNAAFSGLLGNPRFPAILQKMRQNNHPDTVR